MDVIPKFEPEHIGRYQADSYSRQAMWYPGNVDPLDFLDFALQDLLEGDAKRVRLNAISNAKRALHAQVDNLCFGFGIAGLSKKPKVFPPKLEFLQKIGVVRPRILNKINSLRNLVEHEYLIPEIGQVQDFVDIVQLFLDATKVYRYNQPCSIDHFIDVFDMTGEYSLCRLDANFQKGNIVLVSRRTSVRQREELHETVTVNDSQYYEWVQMILRNDF